VAKKGAEMTRNMKPFLSENDGVFSVWSEDMNQPKNDRYIGPTAEVSQKGEWLYIITDDYDGVAMMNIETLPALRKALGRIAKRIKA
jgi:hypothetical protein